VPVPSAPTGSAWAPLLTELARQLDTGRIYTRDLNAILPTFDQAPASAQPTADALTLSGHPSCLLSGEVEPPPDGRRGTTDRAFRRLEEAAGNKRGSYQEQQSNAAAQAALHCLGRLPADRARRSPPGEGIGRFLLNG
jgi:hypothetical protein